MQINTQEVRHVRKAHTLQAKCISWIQARSCLDPTWDQASQRDHTTPHITALVNFLTKSSIAVNNVQYAIVSKGKSKPDIYVSQYPT